MMCISRIILCIAAITCTPLSADTIVLKGGTKHQGHVISENDTSYLFEIRVSDTITDERRIPKDQVVEIIKESADIKAFRSIAAVGATPDLLPSGVYIRHIMQVSQFIEKFPESSKIKEARKILAQLEKEQKTIAGGGIKLDGELIPKSDMEANAYEIDARILLHEMKQLAASARHHEALRKWEILQKDYQNSSAYQKAAPDARRVLRNYHYLLKQLSNSLDARNQKRASALTSMGENDRLRTEAALAEKEKQLAALAEHETTTLHLKWLTVDTFNKPSIDASLSLTTASLSALAIIKFSEIKQAGSAYRDAWTALAKNDIEDATEKLKTLESFHIPARYTEPLQKRLKAKQETQLEAVEKAKQAAAAAEKARQEKLALEAAAKAAEEAKKPKGKKNRKKPVKP